MGASLKMFLGEYREQAFNILWTNPTTGDLEAWPNMASVFTGTAKLVMMWKAERSDDNTDAVLRIEPDEPDVLFMAGEAHLFQEEYREAIEAFNQAIHGSPECETSAHLVCSSPIIHKTENRYQFVTRILPSALSVHNNGDPDLY